MLTKIKSSLYQSIFLLTLLLVTIATVAIISASIISMEEVQIPEEGMKFLLQSRHLAPTYGSRTLIAPENEDHLVINEIPDIFHAGHVHFMGYCKYRGTLIVNSGAWQRQTEYQKEMGHIPNPGICPIVNLKNFEITTLNFSF